MILCAICNREARGFGFCLSLRFDLHPHHHFCSMRCLDRGEAIAREANGMIDKTAREIQALKDARRPFAEAITELGLMPVFHDRKPEDIAQIIEAVVTGYVDSMLRQAGVPERTGTFDDPVPF
jgi:hypothetical protein